MDFIKMKKQIIILIAILSFITLVFAVETIIKYGDKTITLTSAEKSALSTNGLNEYNIEDSLIITNGESRTSRCIMKEDKKIRCFNIINGDLKPNEILIKLNDIEKKVIQQEAQRIIRQQNTQKTKIGEGKTIIK